MGFRGNCGWAPPLAAAALVSVLAGCSSTPTAPTPTTGSGFSLGSAVEGTPAAPTAIIPIPPQALGATRFLAFGDSITFGSQSSFDGSFLIQDEAGSYPRLLRAMLNQYHSPQTFSVINEGVPGETARVGADRLPRVLETHRPQVVMLLEGINDMNVNNATPSQVAANVLYMTQVARLFNCTVLVATMPQTFPSTYPDGNPRTQSAEKIVPYNNELRRQLSGLQNVFLVDVFEAFERGANRSLMGADGLHPTSAGYERMAQAFHERIVSVFPVRGSLQ